MSIKQSDKPMPFSKISSENIQDQGVQVYGLHISQKIDTPHMTTATLLIPMAGF